MEKPCRIMDYIRPGPYRLQWDSLMTTLEILETVDKVKETEMLHLVSPVTEITKDQ